MVSFEDVYCWPKILLFRIQTACFEKVEGSKIIIFFTILPLSLTSVGLEAREPVLLNHPVLDLAKEKALYTTMMQSDAERNALPTTIQL